LQEPIEGLEFSLLQDLPGLLTGSAFESCTFKGLNLAEKDFRQARFVDCRFDDCNLSNIVVVNTVWRNCAFNNCKLVGINWSTARTLSSLVFKKCQQKYSIFQNIKIEGMEFEECQLQEADFSEANLKKVKFCHCDLFNASFSHSDLTEADLRGAINYTIDLAHTKVKNAHFSMPEAMVLLESLGIKLEK
jgi:fluoroquinolone resistance protein